MSTPTLESTLESTVASTLESAPESALREPTALPAEPGELLLAWLADAVANNVAEPTVLSLATTDADGRATNRIVRALDVTADGVVFTSHASSQKGRDLASNNWASAVAYWRETKQQIIIAGPVEPLSATESDALWAARPVRVNAMSSVAVQSAPLTDEAALRAAAKEVAELGEQPTRPQRWLGYRLVPTTIEFWQAASDGLHIRRCYQRTAQGWTAGRRQP